MYAVLKNPIKVVEITGSDNINNYSEKTFRKLDGVPAVANRYLKWENGDADKGMLLAMTADEQAAVDSEEQESVFAQVVSANKEIGSKLLLESDWTQSCLDALEGGRITEYAKGLFVSWRAIVYENSKKNTPVDWDVITNAKPDNLAVG